MSLDAVFLTFLTKQLNNELVGGRVEKIFMPSRDESVFVFRAGSKKKLVISVSTNSPRMSLTSREFENPAVPPAFCMLLRKHFQGGKLTGVRMPDFERCIMLDFECKNDFYETVNKSIAVELMGRSANMILIDGDGRIIDAVRKADLSSERGRCILPSVRYQPAPVQEGKIPFDRFEDTDILFKNPELTLERALMSNISGISPLVARELAYRSALGSDKPIGDLSLSHKMRLCDEIAKIKTAMANGDCHPTLIKQKSNGKLVDFCFMPIMQYGAFCECIPCETPSDAVEGFFGAAADKARFEQRTKDLSQFILRTCARITRTMSVREKELKNSEKAEQYRVYGELINANLYRMTNGMRELECENYYEDCKTVKIPLRPELSPAQNAQAYFKKYTKARNSAGILVKLIEKDKEELSYLDSVFMALCDCETTADAGEIREELIRCGYIKRAAKSRKPEKPNAPRKYEFEGYTVYVGRNNLQNDYVTVKLSRKNDIWLHTKHVHSSHVLISCGGTTPPDSVIEYAARLCAYYSKAKDDLKVEVDYCPVGNVRKPSGAKPGMVVYDGYNTVVVTPMEENDVRN